MSVFDQRGLQGSKSLSHLPKVTQLVSLESAWEPRRARTPCLCHTDSDIQVTGGRVEKESHQEELQE